MVHCVTLCVLAGKRPVGAFYLGPLLEPISPTSVKLTDG